MTRAQRRRISIAGSATDRERGRQPRLTSDQLATFARDNRSLRRCSLLDCPGDLVVGHVGRLQLLGGRGLLGGVAFVGELGGIATILQQATPKERAAAYSALGLRLTYDDRTRQVRVTADLARVANRVGGPTRYISHQSALAAWVTSACRVSGSEDAPARSAAIGASWKHETDANQADRRVCHGGLGDRSLQFRRDGAHEDTAQRSDSIKPDAGGGGPGLVAGYRSRPAAC